MDGPVGCCIIVQPEKGKGMQKSTLEAVGLKTGYDIPAGELFSANLDASKYGLDGRQMSILHCLKDFVNEYNREVPKDNRTPLTDAVKAAAFLYPTLRSQDHEEVWAVFLNSANVPVNTEVITTGGISASIIDCRSIVRKALECSASGMILYHNHPSGNPTPSAADVRETEKLKKCLGTFDISLVDHIVISDSRFYSFAEEKTMKYSL